jgi:hypothetical protein
MKIRRIQAKTMRQGIRRVRDEIGPQAVILSSREVQDGVEVIAALDFDEESVREQARRDERRVAPAEEREDARGDGSLAEPADFAALLQQAGRQGCFLAWRINIRPELDGDVTLGDACSARNVLHSNDNGNDIRGGCSGTLLLAIINLNSGIAVAVGAGVVPAT